MEDLLAIPGEAGGVPPSFDWSKSTNLESAQVLYPAPKRFTDKAGDTVGYKGTVLFPVRLKPKDASQADRRAARLRLRRVQGHLHSRRS